MRSDLPWLLQSVRGDAQPVEPTSGATLDVLDALRENGALFTNDIVTLSRRLPSEVEDALWDGVARGLLTADGFSAVRRLLVSRRLGRSRPYHRGLRHGVSGYSSGEGRWSLVPRVSSVAEHDALAEAIAEQLLVRWGVVFRDVVARETIALPWRDIVWALRRMEARGTARGGRFVTGFAGEQFASAGGGGSAARSASPRALGRGHPHIGHGSLESRGHPAPGSAHHVGAHEHRRVRGRTA